MNLFEYQKQAITTKIYADEAALSYLALGLGGESIELLEKIEENKQDICEVNDELLALIAKEIGDVYWYLAGIAEERGLNLQQIVNSYQKPLSVDIKLQEVTTMLIIKTGVVLEVFKKALRDDYNLFINKILTVDKGDKTNQAIADIVSTLEYLAEFFGVSTQTILQQNVDKLRSRAQRGVLGGS